MAELTESYYTRLGGKLGVAPIHSDRDLAALVEKRLPVAAIKSLVTGGLSDAEVYELIVPRRTLSHRIAKHEPLSKDESDRAVRVARITTMAERAFRDVNSAWHWLRRPKRRFGGKTPLEMMATEASARLVEEMILQFEYGMIA
jgi:putative toxin-antitoxin system antitoxin component (TIGR02293 family)